MKALIEISGQQFNVAEGDSIKAPLQTAEPGTELTADKILMSSDGENINIGTPTLEGTVTAEIVEHIRDPKILVFHKKRRKGYRKLNGHRQRFSVLKIKNIAIN
jgi:large subunit ribosomal protein L21